MPDSMVALKTRGSDPAFTDSTDAETQIKSHWAQKGVRVPAWLSFFCSLRIQVCCKEGIASQILLFLDGFGFLVFSVFVLFCFSLGKVEETHLITHLGYT